MLRLALYTFTETICQVWSVWLWNYSWCFVVIYSDWNYMMKALTKCISCTNMWGTMTNYVNNLCNVVSKYITLASIYRVCFLMETLLLVFNMVYCHRDNMVYCHLDDMVYCHLDHMIYCHLDHMVYCHLDHMVYCHLYHMVYCHLDHMVYCHRDHMV